MNENILTTAGAIREGLLQAAEHDQNVIFMAEGVKEPTGFFGTLSGFDREIDSNRLIEMPIAENGLIGIAIGAAMSGKKVVISLQRVEFAMLALEQIFNNAAKSHYVSNGAHSVPIVLRLVVGRGWGQGPEHSQSLESMFAMFPGLKVVMPVFPRTAKGLIIGAVNDPNPVIFIEHRWCHYVQGRVRSEYYSLPLNGPQLLKEGRHCTIVASSYSVLEALEAGEILKKYEIFAEIFDLSVLRPLNLTQIISSVKKTGYLITIDTGSKFLGMGSEIVSQVYSELFNDLKSPPIRLGLPDHPTPSSKALIDYQFYPNLYTILESVILQLGITGNLAESIKSEALKNRGLIKNDVPNPAFKGPF
jgi:pyruvate/2-oxoglutarate/acetoin dehydrogenase E1 component